MKIGFIGRSKMLADTINLVLNSKDFDISFIWTSKDESYYEYNWEKFEVLAKNIGCPFIFSSKIEKSKNIPKADIVISVNFVNLIPIWFLDKFKYGVLNAHAGDLPRYKGNACPNWAILNGEDEVVLTIHRMDESLDSGPVYCKSKFNLQKDTYISDVYNWMYKETPIMFHQSIIKVLNGEMPTPQTGRTLRTFPRKPEDARLDFSKGIEWNYRLIRASSKPLDGAFCYLNDGKEKVNIWNAIPVSLDFDIVAINGQIIDSNNDESTFVIAVGNEALHVSDFSIGDFSKKESYKVICGSLRNRLT